MAKSETPGMIPLASVRDLVRGRSDSRGWGLASVLEALEDIAADFEREAKLDDDREGLGAAVEMSRLLAAARKHAEISGL